MPELPEVETIVRGLKDRCLDQSIGQVFIRVPKIFKGDSSKILQTPIIDVARKGKVIIIRFENNYSLCVHLKMTGQLIWIPKKSTVGSGWRSPG